MFDPVLDPSIKAYPHASLPLRRSQVGQQGWNVLRGDLPFPVAVVRQTRLAHNLRWMQQFTQSRGLHLAPHGKTTLSPQLFQRQLQAGAWGMTVASVTQLQVALAGGARRCIIANQVFCGPDLAQIAQLQRHHADLRVLFLLDSPAQLALIEQWHAACAETPAQAVPEGTTQAPHPGAIHTVTPAISQGASLGSPRAFDVLLEIGIQGGRTGCRTHAQALALARLARASPAVRLCGVECFEGVGSRADGESHEAYTQAWMQRVVQAAQACDAEGLFEADPIIVSAGGSAIFDVVARWLAPTLSKPVHGVLRSGCYLTHDQGGYQRYALAMHQRQDCGSGLQAALEVWAQVQSTPEPGLVILTVGKRDISYDQAMPTALRYCRPGSSVQQAAPAGWQITALNDQHAYLHLYGAGSPDATLPPGAPLQVGDLVCLGISHPCTTFDKWRWMPIVDEDCNVVDALTTCF